MTFERHHMSAGKFELQKWPSNRDCILRAVPEDFREDKPVLELINDDCLTTLSVYCQPHSTTDIVILYNPVGRLAYAILLPKS